MDLKYLGFINLCLKFVINKKNYLRFFSFELFSLVIYFLVLCVVR